MLALFVRSFFPFWGKFSDIGSDYVHVTAEPMMAVDSDTRDSTTTSTATTTATSNGHYDDDDDVELRDMNYSGGSGSSPFVHVKKKPATTSTMGERATSGTAEMEAGGGGGGGVGGGGVVAADSGEIVDEEEPEDEVGFGWEALECRTRISFFFILRRIQGTGLFIG